MKTQGNFLYIVNGENKTKDEIVLINLEGMNCTVYGLIISYFSPAKKGLPSIFALSEEYNQKSLEEWSGSPKKETIRTKTEEILEEVDRYQKEVNGGILKGQEFPYDFTNRDFEEKDDVITSSNRGEKEVMQYLNGKKESQTLEKAPVFTYCKQMKNAIEALSLRSLYGHKKYEIGDDWENFSRVENGQFEYSNAAFRHALGIGEEDEKAHLIAEAWNSVAKLELFLRKDLEKSK